jgi:PadR family transcriptional regulator PadR
MTDLYGDDRGVLQGTLDLLVLKALSWGRAHGYGVASWIEQVTDDALRVEEGSLYPALHRLERKKLISSRWGLSENNRKAKFYSLTAKGGKALDVKAEGWARLVIAVDKAMRGSSTAELAR